jgi:oligopeptide/dipeptide ABC transporter ATP-binding protein
MIAIALACNPTLLIADEPTTALDVTIQAQLVELIKDIQKKLGMALIWITHDLGVVAGIAERVVVMYAGFVVEDAKVDDLYGNPLHPYTSALLESLPRVDDDQTEKLATIEGIPPGLLEPPECCPFEPRCSFAKDICRNENPPLEELKPGHRVACWVDINSGELR